jgi:DNA-binding CsgD family transcriptional regulator
MGRQSGQSASLSHIRLLCATAVPAPLVIPDVLSSLHAVVPAAGYVFTWFGEDAALSGMYCEPPLDVPVPEFLKDPQRLLAQAGYQGDHLLQQTLSGHVAEISASPAFKRSEFYDSMCRPAGVDHGWDGFIRVGGQTRAVLALWRDAAMPPVSAVEESQLRSLFPHLTHLLAVEAPDRAEGRLLSSGEHGLAVVDGRGRIVHACAEARRMLWYLAHPAFRTNGAMGGDGPAPADAIEEVSRRLVALVREQPSLAPGLELRNQWGAFSIRGFVLGNDPAGLSDASTAMFGLQLSRRVPPEVVAVRWMAQLPLSLKQKELCLHLVRGQKPVQIEAELGIKPTTQKDYLQRIYDKLQITSREELFDRLLQPPRSPLGLGPSEAI